MVSGERRIWGTRFRAIDRKFLCCVARVWWQSIAHLPRSSCEDTITAELVDSLSRDPEAREGFDCHREFPSPTRSPRGWLTGKSRVDIAVIVGRDRAAYLAYECKRLNVTGADGARRSQAGAYVGDEGMMRYITEKYAEGLPVGCMMGYVMDGDLDFARARIRVAMTGSRAVLGLQGDLRAQASIGQIQRFATDHVSGGKSIEILHALLPFVNGPDGPDAEGGKGEECGVPRHKAAAMGAPAEAGAALRRPMPSSADMRSFQAVLFRQLEALPAICKHNDLNSQGLGPWPT